MKKLFALIFILTIILSCSKTDDSSNEILKTYIKVISTTPEIGGMIDNSNIITAKLNYYISSSDRVGDGIIRINVFIRCKGKDNKEDFSAESYGGPAFPEWWLHTDFNYTLDLDDYKFLDIYHPVEIKFAFYKNTNGPLNYFYVSDKIKFKN